MIRSEHPTPAAARAASAGPASIQRYRIYGDNILECEHALDFMAKSVAGDDARVVWVPSPLFAPRYEVMGGERRLFEAQLFPGYGRWGYNVQEHLRQLGAPLREATDAVVLRLDRRDEGILVAVPLLAFEFCGALPAGNNAWQRCGRALACAKAGVPYLYFAELGGVELDARRIAKAARLPNPLVPFAYLSLGQTIGSVAVPIFTRSPSISEEVAKPFLVCLGEVEAQAVVRGLVTRAEDPGPAIRGLQEKAARATQVLASVRKRKDTLLGEEWTELAGQPGGAAKAAWLLRKRMPWMKKAGIQGLTGTFPQLLAAAIDAGAVAAGSRDMPICLLGPESRDKFAASVARLYGKKVTKEFIAWLGREKRPLVVVWVCGFKPRGDDSRPDRGLVPLARMLFGSDGVQYLAVVYGPAKAATWTRFATDIEHLARTNGLWEAVVGLSDAILVDSTTAGRLESIGVLLPTGKPRPDGPAPVMPVAEEVPAFGEHDVDTILHALFSNAASAGVFEAMCNPPGGDWSGLSFQSSFNAEVLRWTSLPRVSGEDAKRPDHVIAFYGPPLLLLSVESKDTAGKVETVIGPRLARYVRELFAIAPNIVRTPGASAWQPYTGAPVALKAAVLSGAACRYVSTAEMMAVLARGEVDVVLAVEFVAGEERTLLHVVSKPAAAWIGPKLAELCQRFAGRIEVQIH